MTAMWLLGNNLPELSLQAYNSWKKPSLHIVTNLIVFCMSPLAEYTQAKKHMVTGEKTHMHTVHAYMNFQVQFSRKKRLR